MAVAYPGCDGRGLFTQVSVLAEEHSGIHKAWEWERRRAGIQHRGQGGREASLDRVSYLPVVTGNFWQVTVSGCTCMHLGLEGKQK